MVRRFLLVAVAMLVAVLGLSVPAHAGGGVVRDDDGGMNDSMLMYSGFETAIKFLDLPTGIMNGATTATLSVYGKAQSCGAGAHRLVVNNTTVTSFDPCTMWSTAAYSWATISINPGLLRDGQSNDFQINDSGGDVYSGNAYYGIDTDHNYGRSIIGNGGNQTWSGELMWYLTVVAPPRPGVTVTPTSIDFGTVNRDSQSTPRTVTVTSTGAASLTVSSVTVGYEARQFPISNDTCTGATLPPGLSCTFQVTYAPITWTGGRIDSTLTVATNAGNPTVALTGYNAAPLAQVSPYSIDYGTVGVGVSAGPNTVRISSTGTGNLSVSPLLVSGNNPSDFVTTNDSCSGATLPPGTSCTFQVTFRPTGGGTRWAYVAVTTNGGGFNVQLNGRGDATAPTSTFSTPNMSVIATGGEVAGSSVDDASAIAAVWITYTPVTSLLNPSTVGATLSNCASRSCDWSAPVPLVPGPYLVTARATDTFGRTEVTGPTITIIVA